MSTRQIEAVKKLTETELDKLVNPANSWHTQYSSSAYIYIGNLDPRLTEGDVITVFSQFGDIVDINMARDKDSGKSLGFCFLAFQNQKSTIIAIDNMIGYPLLGRTLRVDHVLDYKPPVRYHPTELDEQGYRKRIPYEPTGAEGRGVGVHNVTESQKKLYAIQSGFQGIINETARAAISLEDEDEIWANQFESSLLKSEPEIKAEESEFATPSESRVVSPRN